MGVFTNVMDIAKGGMAILFLLILGITGCDLVSRETSVFVVVPDIPGEIAQVASDIRFDLIAGSVTVAQGVHPDSAVAVTVPAGDPVALRAYMRIPGLAVDLPPAGAVLRESNTRSEVSLQFDTGVAATVTERLARAGVPTSAVNIDRLVNEIHERAGERQWDIDLDSLIDAFVADQMHARLLDPIDGTGVVVEGALGEWVRVDALRPDVLTADSDQGLVIASLSPGTHVFAAVDSSQWLVVSVTADGKAGWILSPRNAS